MSLWRNGLRAAGILAVAAAIGACRAPRQVRDPDYAHLLHLASQAAASPDPVVEAIPPVVHHLEGAQPVEVFVRYALEQNPQLQAARKRVDAAASRVPQAASLDDPELELMGFPFYPAVPQTAAGRTTVRLAASQAVPWLGKLRTRASVAEAETDAARAELASMELEVIDEVKQAYYELYYAQKAIGITEEDRELLLDLTRIAESKYRTGEVSQQDVLRAQVEISNLDGELIRLRQELQSGQARLARLLHVSPDTRLRAVDQLPPEQVPRGLELLYQQAIRARPDLHAQLAEIRRHRGEVELARLAYFPDFKFTVDWASMTTSGAMAPTADGIDDVGIGLMLNVPVYRQRLAAGVREAEAQAVSSARQYDSLRDRAAERVMDLYAQATSQYELVRLFREEIIPKSQQTLDVSRSAYQVGQVDFLQLIDNWRQLLRVQVASHRLESQLQQTLAMLERAVGGELPADTLAEPAPASP